MAKTRKEIHLPTQIIHDLKIVSAYSDKSVKKFMEDVIVQVVQLQIKKIRMTP
jgi:hypothetical protein